jgi:hypothetical protein
MEIKKIYSMHWATPDNTYVGLIADTDTGNNEDIGTPYNETSIIWDAVRAFPVDQITPYVPPPEPPVEANLLN